MQAIMPWIQANWTWLGPLVPVLINEIVAASPLKANSLGQLLISICQWMTPKKV
jgi:hypothetical protein